MPTIEFFGYSHEENISIVKLAKRLLADLPFCIDIVFVIRLQEPSKVIGWNGSEHPFIRIFTRSRERADLIKKRLIEYTDIEVVLIDFYTRTKNM